MKARERMFFGVSDMTAWKFAGVNILHILLILSHYQKKIHGRAIKQLFAELFDGIWVVGDDLLYTILNTYEQENYVSSMWDKDEDSNKRYIRYYWITDEGVNYYKTLKQSFSSTLQCMEKIFALCLKTIWGNAEEHPKMPPFVQISSSTFTVLNVLDLLRQKKHSSKNKSWLYGREIRQELKKIYDGLWIPSDGVLYPQLSSLEVQGYVTSRWATNDESEFKKKRTVREYMITEKGENFLLELLSPQSGLKNKIIDLQTLCQISLNFIDGKISPAFIYKKASA